MLLGGTVRPTGLTGAIDRSVLELPITTGRSLLDLWCDQTSQLARMVGRKLIVRVLIDKDVQPPKSVADHPQIDLQMQRDPFELRGTGGILKDATADLTDNDYILIAAANQVVSEPLARVAESLAALGGDVAVIAHEEGQPSNIMLLRHGVLKDIPDIGFLRPQRAGDARHRPAAFRAGEVLSAGNRHAGSIAQRLHPNRSLVSP